MRHFTKLLVTLIAFPLTVGIISCGSPSSPDAPSGTGNNTLTFRGTKNAVVAGDIAVSSDGGTTLKYVPADSWNESTYTGYTALGVCVNTSYMINLVNENMSWNTATSTYPNDNWRMPTNAELKAIYNVKGTLNTSLATISGAEQLIDSYYLSSETLNDEFACVVDFGDGRVKYYYKTDSKLVRVVRALN